MVFRAGIGISLAVFAAGAGAKALPQAVAPAARVSEGFRSEADAILAAAYRADEPGAAAIIVRDGQLVYAAARGLADLASRRPITPATLFRLGSITKQCTAATILQLVADGRIGLDDPLSRHLPDFPEPGAGATIRQLLNHTSGIFDFTKIPGWLAANADRPRGTADLVRLMAERPSAAPPGTAWEYNNGGYVLLGAVIEQVTGKPWHVAMAERITGPLGLRSIVHIPDAANAAALATGHTEAQGVQQPVRNSHISVPHAAGGLHGTVEDLARWAAALHGGKVVAPALYQEMIRPARLADGRTEPYGFGLRLQKLRDRPVLAHGGAIRGFGTASLYLPSEKLFVAVFANSDDARTETSVVARRLAAAALGAPLPVFAPAEVKPESMQSFVGVYAATDGPPRRFFHEEGRFFVARGEERRRLFPAEGGRFLIGQDGLAWLRFVQENDGRRYVEIHRSESAAPERATRIGDIPTDAEPIVPASVLQTYVGTYRTEGPTMVITMVAADRLSIGPEGGKPLPMRPVSPTEFIVDEANTRITFHPEGERVDRLTMRRGARELHGTRVAQ